MSWMLSCLAYLEQSISGDKMWWQSNHINVRIQGIILRRCMLQCGAFACPFHLPHHHRSTSSGGTICGLIWACRPLGFDWSMPGICSCNELLCPTTREKVSFLKTAAHRRLPASDQLTDLCRDPQNPILKCGALELCNATKASRALQQCTSAQTCFVLWVFHNRMVLKSYGHAWVMTVTNAVRH